VLAEWKKVDSITINKEDNPICAITTWRYYLLNRIQLKKINNQSVTMEDLATASSLFSPVFNWTLRMPDVKLLSIMGQDKYSFSSSYKKSKDEILIIFLLFIGKN
jgi:hypothetical protein